MLNYFFLIAAFSVGCLCADTALSSETESEGLVIIESAQCSDPIAVEALEDGEKVVAVSAPSALPFVVKVTDDEGKAITEIVTTLGKSSIPGLAIKKGHLKTLGAGLKGIGPLHFLGYIFSNNELKSHMKTIQKSSTKWNALLEGLKSGLERDLKSQKLGEELQSFATLTKADHQKLLIKAEEHNWDDFVGILVESEGAK